MSKYEVWDTAEFNGELSSPIDTKLIVDSAMILAEEASRYGKLIVVVCKNEGEPLKILGFGIRGKWVQAINCKYCAGDFYIASACALCKGAGWKPYK